MDRALPLAKAEAATFLPEEEVCFKLKILRLAWIRLENRQKSVKTFQDFYYLIV
jgi:hypothetical protein